VVPEAGKTGAAAEPSGVGHAPRCSRRGWLAGLVATACAPLARAHGFKAGGVRIDHPYAPPSLAGTRIGAVYFRALQNTGAQADRLLEARTEVAASVEFHRMALDGEVMRMRAVEAIDLPAGAGVPTRHDHQNGYHLMLRDLKAPLREGERFALRLRLRLERAGWVEVMVWVQNPRQPAAHAH
jgi:hypothetical protein